MAIVEPYGAIVKHGVKIHGECLLFKGNVGRKGYGKTYFMGKHLLAHRVVYEKWHGPIPNGLHVDHDCHNWASREGKCAGGPSCLHKRCVNPSHLRAVTCGENLRAPMPRCGPRKTHCPRGHQYSSGNTTAYINARGAMQRSCKTCEHERTRQRVKAGAFRGR